MVKLLVGNMEILPELDIAIKVESTQMNEIIMISDHCMPALKLTTVCVYHLGSKTRCEELREHLHKFRVTFKALHYLFKSS